MQILSAIQNIGFDSLQDTKHACFADKNAIVTIVVYKSIDHGLKRHVNIKFLQCVHFITPKRAR